MSSSPAAPDGAVAPVGSREQTYLIAEDTALSPASAGPLDFDWVVEQLDADPAVQVQATLHPRSVSLQQNGASVLQTVVVAAMPAEKAAELAAHPQVVLELDHPVVPLPAPAPPVHQLEDPAFLSPFGTSASWQLRLQTRTGDPVPDATVYLYGRGVPAQGRTDARGEVTISLLNESDATLRALYVNPLRDLWSMWVDRPALTSGVLNTVVLTALGETLPEFPQQQLLGWGQLAMRLDQVPGDRTGRGIKVAVIDSGAAVHTHPDLAGIRSGIDLAGTPGSDEWTVDVIAHGSHCSGIVAGSDNAHGIRGFAPAAEVHEARIFPGGRISSLLDAVDYCIDQRMDVVNMSLGAGGSSQILLQKLAQAREQGTACIVAAGNSGDGVQFPGVSPDVLTVAAIGQEGTFPADSYHAQQRWAGGTTDHGLFAAAFSCHGPEVDVCAPGVAVVSSVPDVGYASWDGTSMATPHVAGLAVLVLAHHPDFQTPALRLPTAARVDRLFQLLRESCRPLDLGDPERTGAGMPDALRALGLDAPGREADPAVEAPGREEADAAAIAAALEQLRGELVVADLLGPDVVPQSAGPAGPPAQRDLRRQLAALRAQMQATGLDPARQPAGTAP